MLHCSLPVQHWQAPQLLRLLRPPALSCACFLLLSLSLLLSDFQKAADFANADAVAAAAVAVAGIVAAVGLEVVVAAAADLRDLLTLRQRLYSQDCF